MPVANLRETNVGIRCDRSSILGNPFEMRWELERPTVVEGFRRYLWLVAEHGYTPQDAAQLVAQQLNLQISGKWRSPTRQDFLAALKRLEKLHKPTLLCWCFPLQCHCDVLIRYLEWRKTQKALSLR